MRPVGPNDRTVIPSAEAPQIGGYTVLRLLGHGGAGRVFAARDEQLGRTVAIKVLHPQVANDPQNVDRFLREARAMATISSPHVASIFQVGQHRNVPFIVMEYLEGQNLEQRLHRDKRVPVEEALIYARDCALALKAADAAGIVHRDVKPANIVVIDGRAKLTDFGTARPLDGSADMTMEGQIAGTATFMAPERVTGRGDDRRADIYSLGATLYCLIDGQPPFVRGSPMDVIAAHLREEAVPLNEKVKGVSPLIAGLVRRMMAKDPAQRFQTYAELVTAIEMILKGGQKALTDEGGFDEATEVISVPAGTADLPLPVRSPAPTTESAADVNDPFASPPSSFGAAPGTNSMVGEPTGVMGTLKQMSIVDICHMLEMGKKDAEIELTALEGINGEVCFLGGQVVQCVWGDQVAEEAFYTLARRKEGFFRIHYGRRTTRQNINVPTAFLVLEAMRRLDEHERGGAAPEPEPDFDFGPEPTPPPSPLDRAAESFHPDTTLPNEAPVALQSGEFSQLSDPPAELPPPPPSSPFGAPIIGTLPTPPAAPRQRPPERTSARPPMQATPVPSRRHTPAPIEGLGAPVRRPSAPPTPVGRSTPGMRVAPSSPSLPSNDSTMLLTPEDEAALRAVEGKRLPLSQRLEPVLEKAAALYQKSFGAALGVANEQLANITATMLTQAGPLAPLAKHVRAKPWLPLVTLCASCFALAFVVVALLSTRSDDGISLARIDAGQAADVLAQIEAVPLPKRTAKQELLRGHALAELGRTSDAILAYHSAAKLGVVDERGLDLALSQLDRRNPVEAMDLLVLHPGEEVTVALLERLNADSFVVRHNAVLVLDERGAKDRVDLEALAMKDLLTSSSCKQRRRGLLDLKKYGRSDAARAAVAKALETKDGDNACMRADFDEMIPK